MNRLQIIESDDRLAQAWLEPFKQYASVPDNGRDALLLHLLKSAILRVQEYADRALLRCRVRQTSRTDAETGLVRLYLGGGEVTSVTFDYGGEEAPYTQKRADSLAVAAKDTEVTVEFTTAPLDSWREKASITVFRLATALYDGESTETCNAILNEVL
jgi:hypothetical protein